MKGVRLPTGIAGLDRITGGGFGFPPDDNHAARPVGAVLIRGEAGTGKSLLAATLAAQASAMSEHGCAIYCLLEQTPAQVRYFLDQFSDGIGAQFATAAEWSERQLDDPTREHLCLLDGLDPAQLDLPGRPAAASLRAQMDAVRERVIRAGYVPAACVLDGLLLRTHLAESLDRLAFEDLARYGNDHGLLMIIVEEGPADGWLQYACDVVLRLQGAHTKPGVAMPIRSLVIEKSRFNHSVEGAHPYEIVSGRGIALYPALRSYGSRGPEPRKPTPRLFDPFGWQPVDAKWQHGALIERGSINLITGPAVVVDSLFSLFLAQRTHPDQELSFAISIHPRSIRCILQDTDETVVDEVVVGDFTTPAEKLFWLVTEQVGKWCGASGRQPHRVGIDGLDTLRAFPAVSRERYVECFQLLLRDLSRAGSTIAVRATRELPDEVSLKERDWFRIDGDVHGELRFELVGRAAEFTIGFRADEVGLFVSRFTDPGSEGGPVR